MCYYSNNVTQTDIRSKPDWNADIITELIFGDIVRIVDTYRNWKKIECCFYPYSGWSCSEFQPLPDNSSPPSSKNSVYALDDIFALTVSSHGSVISVRQPHIRSTSRKIIIPTGGILYDYRPSDRTFLFEGSRYHYPYAVSLPEQRISLLELIQIAKKAAGNPYRWGGTTLTAPDCSGFIMRLCSLAGIFLPRDAYQQFDAAVPVASNDLKPCDLIFFQYGNTGRAMHIALIESIYENENCVIIHSDGASIKHELVSSFLERANRFLSLEEKINVMGVRRGEKELPQSHRKI
jgi:gamma-D-glutamyl-L-lysine dipeptidyl-peptidase